MENNVNKKFISILILSFFVFLISCASTYRAFPEESISLQLDNLEKVIYIAGDFGSTSGALKDITRAIAEDVKNSKFNNEPFVLGVGDNLYLRGFAHGKADVKANNRIWRIAELFAQAKQWGNPIPVVVVPGNHDYDGNAIEKDRAWGDISHWYFLNQLCKDEKLGSEVFSNWHHYPGDLQKTDKSPQQLYERIYKSTESLVTFMKPVRVKKNITGEDIALIAIDSELLIDLYYYGMEDLAQVYLKYLRKVLEDNQNSRWIMVAAHHPLETYAKHRPGKLGSFVFGPGWPQFPQWWHKVLIVPPFGSIATLGWWGVHYRQDIHSSPYSRYREEVYKIIDEMNVDLFFAGHDHASQIINLNQAFEDDDTTIITQVVSGEASKQDPVTSGAGTYFYHTGNGYSKIMIFPDYCIIQIKNRKGKHLYQYVLRK